MERHAHGARTAASLSLNMLCAIGIAVATPTVVPTVRLTNGVLPGALIDMPILAAGTAGYKGSNATAAVERAITAGFTHLHTAFDYFNLVDIGKALQKTPRNHVFVSSMTSPCQHGAPPQRNVTDLAACHNLTINEGKAVIKSLGLEYLDLLMLHGPSEPFGHSGGCSALACQLNAVQWHAYLELLRSGLVKSIGVSNFCQSCLACLGSSGAVDTPAVNQIQVHVGQGSADPGGGLLSYNAKRGIVVQSYEPLAGGDLAKDADCARIGRVHNRTAAQVALRWVLDRVPSLAVRAGTTAHLLSDLDALDFTLSATDLALLDQKSGPPGEAGGRCSWGCTM